MLLLAVFCLCLELLYDDTCTVRASLPSQYEDAPVAPANCSDDSPRLEAGSFLGSSTLALSSQGRMQDIQRGILVPITHYSTLLTAVDSY